MTVYVRRDGHWVDKQTGEPMVFDTWEVAFPTPRVSRMEPFESPITGKEVTSWGERDREMRANECFDTRDLSPDHHWRRGRKVQLEEVRANGRRPE